ncbi:DUF4132 domain-containing protein [Endozoicomonadaceae bacterium StTr2]
MTQAVMPDTDEKQAAKYFTEPSDPRFDALVSEFEQAVLQSDAFDLYGQKLPCTKEKSYTALKALKGQDKIDLIFYLVERVKALEPADSDSIHSRKDPRHHFTFILLQAILRTKIEFPDNFSFLSLYDHFYSGLVSEYPWRTLIKMPLAALVSQIEKFIKARGSSDLLVGDIRSMLEHPLINPYLNRSGPDFRNTTLKLKTLLLEAGGDVGVPEYNFRDSRTGHMMAATLADETPDQKEHWNRLLHHLAAADGPCAEYHFLETSYQLAEKIGLESFQSVVKHWLEQAADMPMKEYEVDFCGRPMTVHRWLEESHSLFKGLLWSLVRFQDEAVQNALARFTEKCFQKNPSYGWAAPDVGDAGLYTLSESPGLGGIGHLSRIKLRVRKAKVREKIERYIAYEAKRRNISAARIEELSAPDFGLTNGCYTESFNDYQLELSVTGVGSVAQQWIKPDGKYQKTAPAFVKKDEALSKQLTAMRSLAKQVKLASTAQRDRIDRLFTEDTGRSLGDFERDYLNHGLISTLARKLIWMLDDTPALFYDNGWQDVQGASLSPDKQTQVRLWHPVFSSSEQIMAWRDRLEVLEIRQPLKQAYREVYPLTDAEVTTRVYSNRMAAHILKQYQFNALATLRGWSYSLVGHYNDSNEIARKSLPEYELEAQFWTNQVLDIMGNDDGGFSQYISTDQVRFVDAAGDPVELARIPPLVLSEVMRDIDLFVGVASVGNDPEWQDAGSDAPRHFQTYWNSYSFGELTEIAKTRKAVLERLLPRLKLKNVATIKGRFLQVQGKRHLYRIHIGSGNILIAPDDRYLCIVPGRSSDKKAAQVFLPFEGDGGLSIVLSKAFLLMDDDKITDPTILQQL